MAVTAGDVLLLLKTLLQGDDQLLSPELADEMEPSQTGELELPDIPDKILVLFSRFCSIRNRQPHLNRPEPCLGAAFTATQGLSTDTRFECDGVSQHPLWRHIWSFCHRFARRYLSNTGRKIVPVAPH